MGSANGHEGASGGVRNVQLLDHSGGYMRVYICQNTEPCN